ncbi:helix-turn-helix domain-containing protein [Amycolatopsis cihanbeyliensis]|uniref:AraC family transcriptional regulator n=1 Tax=Amycolatopsis cihanbeyliensis TaxID=1128664 RepID=A0A542DEP7_AMYCI|nr:helix-turn-helix domain-containing protein [Amycolatopsis cihanbeyliensis]TQJ01530.1 AraC family transcriptional regulator [Amycolatopsis cihanbeyliensis]
MYHEATPPARLRHAVRCLWWSAGEGTKPIVPDGCLDLIVAADRVFVAGPDTGPWRSAPGTGALHGVRFRPGHAPRVLNVAADELRDQRVTLPDLWGRHGAGITDLLLSRPAALGDVVAEHLTERLDPGLDLLVARLTTGVPRVSAALSDLETGERQLRRRFTLAVGYGPATYLRVARLQRAVAAAPTASDLSSLALAAGYADQAHLSRDCRELTGRTPGEFFPSRRPFHSRPPRPERLPSPT